jgi:hypothetical protein
MCSSLPLTQIELEQPVGGDERLAPLPLAAAPYPHPTVPAAARQPSTAPVQAAHGVAVGRHSRSQPSYNTHLSGHQISRSPGSLRRRCGQAQPVPAFIQSHIFQGINISQSRQLTASLWVGTAGPSLHTTHIFQGIKYLAVQAAYGVAVGRHSRSQPSHNTHRSGPGPLHPPPPPLLPAIRPQSTYICRVESCVWRLPKY